MPRRLASVAAVLPLCVYVLVLAMADKFFGGEARREWWWGGLQLWSMPLPVRLVVPVLPVVVLVLPARMIGSICDWFREGAGVVRARMRGPAVGFLALFALLWVFRSVSLTFGDSEFYVRNVVPEQAFSLRGATLNFDAVGSTLLVSWSYRWANRIAAVDPLTWYNLVGIACLLAFFLWAWAACSKERLLGSGLALMFLFGGNWSQTTFGPAENYGQVMLATLGFAILGIEALRGREPLWKAVAAYSLGAFFHLVIAWAFPALVFLFVARWKAESPEGRNAALTAAIFPAVVTGLLIYYMGFDFSMMSDSNAAEGKLIPFLDPMHPYSGGYNYHYSTFDPKHLVHILMENVLMGWPGLVVLAAGAPALRGRDFRNVNAGFLMTLLAGFLLFNLLWNPDLLFWRDQDLFSFSGLACCILAAWMLFGPLKERLIAEDWRRLALLGVACGWSWRIMVILFHSLLAVNYSDVEVLQVVRPF